jgi:pilus assembly protein Flp/PilA
MKNVVSELDTAIKGLRNEEGQDLVEYALVVALLAFGCAASMTSLARAINASFSNIINTLGPT